jgi:hypothetical protein
VHAGTQDPSAQTAPEALAVEQTCPQTPQSSGSLDTSLSHPSSGAGATGWLQSSQPVEQVGAHTPPVQLVAVAFVPEQARSQAPQCAGSLFKSVSQPSSASGALGWLQSVYPPVQVGAQTPALQTVAEALSSEHVRPQTPQCAVSVPRLVSHPSSAWGGAGWAQSPKVPLQVGTQAPSVQTVVEALAVEQT